MQSDREPAGMGSKIRNVHATDNPRRVLSASSLIGDPVRNDAGEDLGKADDLMIDLVDGRVAYAVLSFGGFLGMGNKLFAIPWSKLAVDEANRCFVLNVPRQTLERAPGFDKDNWPDMADPSWQQQLAGHYGVDYDTSARERTLRGGGGL